MLSLDVGLLNKPKLPRGGFLYIGDEVPEIPQWRRPKVFDYTKHHFNLLSDLTYRKSCEIVDIFDAANTRGETTIMKDTGLEFIADRLEMAPATLKELIPEPDKKSSTGHVWAYNKVRRVLRSPVLSAVLCNPDNAFKFNPNSVILARINRAELGDDDARFLGLALIAQFKGQIVVEDFEFYGRDTHVRLIREGRLSAQVNRLGTVRRKAPELYDALLSIPEKHAAGANYDDAVLLAKHNGLHPDPSRESNPFNDFVASAMA